MQRTRVNGRAIAAMAMCATALSAVACTSSSQGTTSAAPAASLLSAPSPAAGAPPMPSGSLSAEANGTIQPGSVSGSCAAHTLAFMVGSTKVITNGATSFNDVTCTALKDGSVVEAKGTRLPDVSILAATVEGSGEDDNENGQEGEVKGAIAAGSTAGACATNNLSFRIGSTTVRTSAQTRFDDTSCTALKAGDSVEIKGARQVDGGILASRVQLEDGHD